MGFIKTMYEHVKSKTLQHIYKNIITYSGLFFHKTNHSRYLCQKSGGKGHLFWIRWSLIKQHLVLAFKKQSFFYLVKNLFPKEGLSRTNLAKYLSKTRLERLLVPELGTKSSNRSFIKAMTCQPWCSPNTLEVVLSTWNFFAD